MARENPFVTNRERSQTLTQHQPYQPTEGRTFLGGVTESRSGFFLPSSNSGQTMDINDGASLGGTMSAVSQQMTPIQSAFPFKDPKIILSQQSTTPNAGGGRRQLPQEPPGLTNQSPSPQFNVNPLQPLQQPPPVRRASSNRMLPTPPPPISPNAFSPSPSPPFNSSDYRRPSSTGRKLPPEPTALTTAAPTVVSVSSLPPPAPTNHLQRSASARTATSTSVNNK